MLFAIHILKIESFSSIGCTIVKSMKVPKLGYGVVFIIFSIIIPSSILKKKLYEVTISDFFSSTCRDFWYMCAFALKKSFKELDSL